MATNRRNDANPDNERGLLADATTRDIASIESQVRDYLQQAAISNISSVQSLGDVVVRDILPSLDLESGGDNGWGGSTNYWTQDGLSADQFNEVYTIDSDAKADQKIIGVFAISNLTASPATTELRIQTGTGATIEQAQTQGLLVDEETTAVLADPIIFGSDEDASIDHYVDNAQDTELVYHGAVAQPEGSDLEESGRFLSDRTS